MTKPSLFPDDAHAERLRQSFTKFERDAEADPLANPVQALASKVFLELEAGVLSLADINGAAHALERDAFADRTRGFHHRREPAFVTERLEQLAKGTFETFQARLEKTPVGIVFTAHPTFALTNERRDLAARYPGPDGDMAQWRAQLEMSAPGAPENISLEEEHEDALAALSHAQNGVRVLNKTILEVARKAYPDQWKQLAPAPISLASWVGYDLDGRTDIHWGQSITIRLKEKALQLNRYGEALDDLINKGPVTDLAEMASAIKKAAQATLAHAEAFSGDLSDQNTVVAAANALTDDKAHRLVTLAPLIERLGQAIDAETNDDIAEALLLLRAEMRAFGLGVSRIHLRVNAAQVRSALKSDLQLDPDKDFFGRSALNVASSKAKIANARAVNFGSVFLEQMTARRQFMLCAQILKHIDADQPIRFLIAECEAPATVMGAIYLARLYGVEEKLDISPLFETPQALEGGGRFIERLLDEPEYVAYVKRRRRMSIQIGYSDSGRFMGQAAASLSAERLQVLFARALGAAKLNDVEALVFNTHGESMGRGAYPGGYAERMAHCTTPWVRSRFAYEGVPLICEFSFQGGEGYLHFQNQNLAENTVASLWSLSVDTPAPDFEDRFYKDINFSWDFYRSLKSWQESLYARNDYRDVIFSFAQHLLYKTGSRKTKRPRQGGGAPEIRSIRAIPHNAILQQMAVPVNVSGGIGAAGGREVDRFVQHVEHSARMRALLAMTGHARSMTGVTILRAYAGLYSPSYWSSLAGMTRRTSASEVYESVLQVLQQERASYALSTLADFLARDIRAYDAIRDKTGQNKNASASGRVPDLGVLHALRQALIARAASLAAQAPAFSRRHDVDRSDIIELTLNLQLEEAASFMVRIFPKESPTGDLMTSLKEPVDGDERHGGAYPEIHRTIIEPLLQINSTLKVLTSAIANHYGAFG
ncbi:MAG: phosphoenolpyruvate carboxylase [Pseudomonadota bacterium]